MGEVGTTNKPAHSLSKPLLIYAFTAVTVVLALAFMLYSLPAPFLPIYHEERKVSSFWDGIILGVVPVGFLISCAPTAFLMERINFKPIMMIGSGSLGSVFIINSFFNRIANDTLYITLSCLFRVIAGFATGLVGVTSFGVLTKLVPTRVAFVTALAEAALNGAQAFGPFLGGLLYDASGYSLAFWVPGLVVVCCVLVELTIPHVNTLPDRTDANDSMKVYKDPWVMMAAWHCAACQILLYFHLPTLAPFAERALDETVVWTGLALLVNTSTIIISAPPLGWLIDKFNPYLFVILSSVILPFLYMFIGPLPLFNVATSKTQVMLVLALLGFFVPMGCTPILLIMFDVYKMRNGGEMSISASNTIVSLYCSCFPLGACIGSFSAGLLSLYTSFEWSTGGLGFVFIVQSFLSFAYCWKIKKMKKRDLEEKEARPVTVLENQVALQKL
ncbi:hypothetical protein ACHWQZ_G014773 [Mnemiopsis leidyi]